jgi:hypothetical protein
MKISNFTVSKMFCSSDYWTISSPITQSLKYMYTIFTVLLSFINFLKEDELNFCILCYCSPDLPESEATFAITAGGIADAKD